MMSGRKFNKYSQICEAIKRKDKEAIRRFVLVNAVNLFFINKAPLTMTNEEKDVTNDNDRSGVVKCIAPYHDQEICKNYLPKKNHQYNNCIQQLLPHGSTIQCKNKSNNNDIYLAVKNGHVAAIEEFIKLGADIDMVNNCIGLTLLHVAHLYQQHELIEMLIKHGADINFAVIEKKWLILNKVTPLQLAVINSDMELIQLLLNNEAEQYNDSHLVICTRIAMQKNSKEIVKMFLECLNDVNAVDDDGNTLLHICASNDLHIFYNNIMQKVSELLLKKGANVNVVNNISNTPLFGAIRYGYVEFVKALLEHDADVDYINNDGDAPLHVACKQKHDRTVINEWRKKPVYLESQIKNLKIIEMLLANKADPDVEDKHGRTPLHIISEGYRSFNEIIPGIIKLLLEYNADINAVDFMGRTPLINVCEKGDMLLAKLMFDHIFFFDQNK